MGVALDGLDMAATVVACVDAVEREAFAHHVSVNAAKVVAASRDAGLARIMREADIASADGQSVVWAARVLGTPVPERVAGIDLAERLLAEAAARRWPVFLLGARHEVADATAAWAREHFPGIVLAGWRDGYFSDDAAVAAGVAATGARLLLVALPSPRKERLLDEQRGGFGPVLAVGVGGSFDVWTGAVRRAPRWMQRCGLEWAYRLLQEPRRMWKRYLVGNTAFVVAVLRERVRRRKQV